MSVNLSIVPWVIDIQTLMEAYELARIINHHQGIHLIHSASETYDWDINMAEVARIWTNGCIIRSELMESLKSYLKEEKEILLYPNIVQKVKTRHNSLRQMVGKAANSGLSIPCFQASH